MEPATDQVELIRSYVAGLKFTPVSEQHLGALHEWQFRFGEATCHVSFADVFGQQGITFFAPILRIPEGDPSALFDRLLSLNNDLGGAYLCINPLLPDRINLQIARPLTGLNRSEFESALMTVGAHAGRLRAQLRAEFAGEVTSHRTAEEMLAVATDPASGKEARIDALFELVELEDAGSLQELLDLWDDADPEIAAVARDVSMRIAANRRRSGATESRAGDPPVDPGLLADFGSSNPPPATRPERPATPAPKSPTELTAARVIATGGVVSAIDPPTSDEPLIAGIAAGWEQSIQLIDPAGEQPIRRWYGPSNRLLRLDGRLMGISSRECKLYSMPDGELQQPLPYCRTLAASADRGLIATLSERNLFEGGLPRDIDLVDLEGRFTSWIGVDSLDALTPLEFRELQRLGIEEYVDLFMPDYRLRPILLDPRREWQARRLRLLPFRIEALALSGDGRTLVAGGHHSGLLRFDTETGALVSSFQTSQLSGRRGVLQSLGDNRTHSITDLAMCADDRHVVTAGQRGEIILWDLEDEGACRTLSGHSGVVTALATHPEAPLFASGGQDGRVILWHTDQQEPIAVGTGHEFAVTALAFTPTGETLLSGGQDTTIRQWPLPTA